MNNHHFVIRAATSPHTLLRLVNHFAQRDLIPSAVTSQTEADWMMVIIIQSGLSAHVAAIIAEKIRSSVMVDSVELSTNN